MNRLFLTIFALAGFASATITDCSKGNGKFAINGLGFWPDPPTPNENATISFLYTVPDGMTVTDGSAKYSYTLNGIPFPGSSDPLCDDASCPMTAGQYNLTTTNIFPSGFSGKFVSTIEWYDTSNTLLLCVQTTARIAYNVYKGIRGQQTPEWIQHA
jgi:hypothetical protein